MANEPPIEAASGARHLLRTARKASLGTLDKASGAPYVSMVSIATDVDGSPILLISSLALHTTNLAADPRVSLLIDTTDAAGDPSSGARLTLTGRALPAHTPTARTRYLAHIPGAAVYADFADFAFWRIEISQGHYIGGFGRIQPLARDVLLFREEA